MMKQITKIRILKIISRFFQTLAVLLSLYILFLPFTPELVYQINKKRDSYHAFPESADIKEKVEIVKNVTAGAIKQLKPKDFQVSQNRLVISKIGVNAPIVESQNEEYGLSLGAWRVPDSSTPDKGGNTVITGHRFKYLPPSNLTFYLFHKLEKDDIISVLWKGEYYFYQIRETKIVEPEAIEIMDPSSDSILTLFTCHPVYSQKQRLVVVGELMD